jgi:DNA-binding HxlR family transcriptional regulator
MSARDIPKPGKASRRTATGRPVMVLLDLLGRRWALRVLWELREGRRLNFRDLLAACDVSPSVLNTRLSELRENAIVEHGEDGYALTAIGGDLLDKLLPITAWAESWAKRK